MICGHPECTGKHGSRFPRTELCPAGRSTLDSASRAWKVANRERSNRRARERGAAKHGYIPLADRTWLPIHKWRPVLLELQGGLCAWCLLPLGDNRPAVDHRHNCQAPHNTEQSACPECVRGIVHYACNAPFIARWEWAAETGLTGIPEHVLEYLTQRKLPRADRWAA